MLNHSPRKRQRAAALIEFQIVLVLGLLPLVLGVLQIALLLVASHVVHYATYQAARSGMVEGADPAVMRRALAVGLLPLHLVTAEPVDASNVTSLALAADLRSQLATGMFARLVILRPTAAAFADFASGQGGASVLRNDSLEHRTAAVGARSGLTLQQANILQIRVSYCHELIVPFINQLLLWVLRTTDDDGWSQLCYAAGRVPLVAQAAVNLQSDARFHGD